jgi:hypothetical protein
MRDAITARVLGENGKENNETVVTILGETPGGVTSPLLPCAASMQEVTRGDKASL